MEELMMMTNCREEDDDDDDDAGRGSEVKEEKMGKSETGGNEEKTDGKSQIKKTKNKARQQKKRLRSHNCVGSANTAEKKIYKCDECGKVFDAQYTLTRHQPIHTGIRKYVCTVCGKTFRHGSTLCRHKAIHSEHRPFKCKVCSKDFNRSSTLASHLKTHCTNKPHVCDVCGVGFHQKGNLKNHMYTHTGERPYHCPCCERSFNQLSNLSYHLHQAHADKRLLTCHVCNTTFQRKYELRKHEIEKHKIVYPERQPPRYARSKEDISQIEDNTDCEKGEITVYKNDLNQSSAVALNNCNMQTMDNNYDEIGFVSSMKEANNNNKPSGEDTASEEDPRNDTIVHSHIVNVQKTTLITLNMDQSNHVRVVISDTITEQSDKQ